MPGTNVRAAHMGSGLADLEVTSENVTEWKGWGSGVGSAVRCDDVVGVDVDVYIRGDEATDEAKAEAAAEAAAVEAIVVEVLGSTPLRRVGRGAMLVYRAAEPFFKCTAAAQPGKDGYKVEYIARGGQFVAFHRHPDTGKPYSWGERTPVNTRVEDVPAVTRAQLDELALRIAMRWGVKATRTRGEREPIATGSPQHAGPIDVEMIRSALAAIPNETLSRDEWVRTGFILKREIGRSGLPAVAGVLAPLSGQHGRRDHDALARARRRRQPLRRRRSPRRLADPQGPAAWLGPAGLRERPHGHADGRSAAPRARAVERCG